MRREGDPAVPFNDREPPKSHRRHLRTFPHRIDGHRKQVIPRVDVEQVMVARAVNSVAVEMSLDEWSILMRAESLKGDDAVVS